MIDILRQASRRGLFLPILALLLTLPGPGARAQNVLESFRPFVNATDLRDIARDSRGNLWIASNGGALHLEFSPPRWTVFPRGLGSGPRGNDLATVCIDDAGRVWVGSSTRGFTFFDPETGVWDRFSEEWPDPSIQVIRCLEGGIYIGTSNGLSLKPTPNRTDICSDADPGCIVPSLFVNDYALLGDTLWVATQGGLGRFNGVTWDSAGALPAGSVGEESLSLAVFEGTLWEATPSGVRRLLGGVWEDQLLLSSRLVVSEGRLFSLIENKVHTWTGSVWDSLAIPLDSGVEIRDIEVFGGSYYMATGTGLVLWRIGEESIARTFFPPSPPLVGVFSGVAVDGDGIVWAGTSEKRVGIARYDGVGWQRLPPTPGGLENQWIWTLFGDRADNLWVGHCCCSSPPACRTDIGRDGTFMNLVGVHDVRGWDQDGNDRIWAATHGSGVHVLEEQGAGNWQTARQFTITGTGGALASNRTDAVAVTDGGTYVGHQTNGLDYWPHGGDLDNGEDGSNWLHVGDGAFGLLDLNVGAMAKTGEDVWVGTSGGLHRFRDGVLLERCPTRIRDRIGDSARKVNAIVPDRLGALWIGTDDGILYLPRGGACDGQGGEFLSFTDENSPLPHNKVLAATRSPADGSIWFGAFEGLLRVEPLAFTGTQPPPDRFVVYPNPLDLSPGSSIRDRKLVFGIEIAGIRVVPAPPDSVSRPEVFDIAGRSVGVFDTDFTISGGAWTWNGKNRNGSLVAPGIYVIRARTAGNETVVQKVGVIR